MLFLAKLFYDLFTRNYLPSDDLIPPESHERVGFHIGYVEYREYLIASQRVYSGSPHRLLSITVSDGTPKET